LSADRFSDELRPGGKPLDGFDGLTASRLGALSLPAVSSSNLPKRRRPYTSFCVGERHSWYGARLHRSASDRRQRSTTALLFDLCFHKNAKLLRVEHSGQLVHENRAKRIRGGSDWDARAPSFLRNPRLVLSPEYTQI
jgi:hypothetical protein